MKRILKSIGLAFPENADELKRFDEIYNDYTLEGDVNKIDPLKILSQLNPTSQKKISKTDYHKRTVLAAEIIFKLKNEYTLGHLKLQKLMYLCQHILHMDLHTNFLKQAMGPYDPNLMRSIDKQLNSHKWFKYVKNDSPKYQSLEKAGEHKNWYEIYYKDHLIEIDFLIEKFRKIKTNRIEIIATVFACWKELLESKQLVNENSLVSKFYNWSEEKSKFKKEQVFKEIQWMKEEKIHPV